MSAAFATATATGAITTVPTLVHSVHVFCSGGGANVTITDGDGGDVVIKLGTVWALHVNGIEYPEPIMVQHGLYVSSITASTTIMVSYS